MQQIKTQLKISLIEILIIFCTVKVAYTYNEYAGFYKGENQRYFKSGEILSKKKFVYSDELKYDVTNHLDLDDPESYEPERYFLNVLLDAISGLEYYYLPANLKDYQLIYFDEQEETRVSEDIVQVFRYLRDLVFLRDPYIVGYYVSNVIGYTGRVQEYQSYLTKDRFISYDEAVYLHNLLNAWIIALTYHDKYIYEDRLTSESIKEYNKAAEELEDYVDADPENIHITPLMKTMYKNIKNGGLELEYDDVIFYDFPY